MGRPHRPGASRGSMKACSTCGTTKPIAEFKRDVRKPDGHASICKACSQERCRGWRAKNNERTRKYNRSPQRVSSERAREQHRAERPHDPVRRRAIQKAWEKANPDKVRVIWRNKRAKRQASIGRHTHNDVLRLLSMQRGRCAYCRTKLKRYHVDHIRALSRGGSNWPANLQLLCAACNMSKNASDPIEFARKIGKLL